MLFYRVDPLPVFIPANVSGLLALVAFVLAGLGIGHFGFDLIDNDQMALGRLAYACFGASIIGFWVVGYRWSESLWT